MDQRGRRLFRGRDDRRVGIDDINVSSAPLVGPPPTTVSIGDASITEGDSGTKTLTFTVTRSDDLGEFTVDYTTTNGSAIAPGDFVAVTEPDPNNTLSFTAGGALTQTVSITIKGDTEFEADEIFTV